MQRLLAVRDEGEVTRSLMQARCERGAQIARMLGLSEATAAAIYALDEHWDGGGHPDGLRGEQIPLGARIANLAQTAEIFWAVGGRRAAMNVAHKRRGGWFDPALVTALDAIDVGLGSSAPISRPYRPPDRPLSVEGDALDRIADGFAAVIDAKSPWTYSHSDRTSVIALSIAEALDADSATLRDLGRAARLHDIGKLGVSNQILDKPAELTAVEFAAVKDHRAHHPRDPRARARPARRVRPGRRPPRAPGRQRLPLRLVGTAADDADARTRGRRRL